MGITVNERGTEADSPAASARELERRERLSRREALADSLATWRRRHRCYYNELERMYRRHVTPGSRVLHVGCGLGDLLAAVRPAEGLGIDLSPAVIEQAGRRHPELRFAVLDPERFELAGETFDYVLLDHAVADMGDIQGCLESVRRASRPETRVILSHHNALWEPLLALASRLGLRRKVGQQNWLGPEDFDNLLRLSDFEAVWRGSETLLPVYVPLLSSLLNRLACRFWPLRHFCLTQVVVARPLAPPTGAESLSCTVVIPTRNERGNVADAVRRTPEMGRHTQIIFVDGNSSDGTPEEIERVIAENPRRDIRLIHQGDGVGKGDAVRRGFAAASGDVLMILDADLTVPPEDLPRFFRAIVEGQGELINGTRLVYPMEEQAMRFLNKLGNRFFSLLFTWIIGQRFRDTLCGTKVLSRGSYAVIEANRGHFGDFDPFGDFDLLFGAARANLKIIEIPVRYRARTYGTTNISRFRHGWLLLKMSWVAFRKLKLG
jgi:SAM-dependent methyltransferase